MGYSYKMIDSSCTALSFKFQIRAVPKQRPRVTRHGTYTPLRTKRFEKEFQILLKNQFKASPIQTPIILSLEFCFEKPKSNKTEFHCQRPDLDNLEKAVLDACNKILFLDDSQVYLKTSQKLWSDKDSIQMKVIYKNE